jgi:hypothetical protein
VIAPRWNTPYADRVRADLVQLVETPEGAERPDRGRRAAGGRVVDRPRVVVTGLVAALVVVVAVLAIRVGLDRPAPGPAASSSASASTARPTRAASEITAELQDAMFALLPPSARTAPALTWTDAQAQPMGGAIDTNGKTMLLAAACEGGGTVTLIVTGSHAPRPAVLHCDGLDTAGPIDLSDAVKVTSGHPRYIAKSVAIDSALVKP